MLQEVEAVRNLFDLVAVVNLPVLFFVTLLTRIELALRLRHIDSTVARRYRRET